MNDKAKICNHRKFYNHYVMNHLLKVLGLVVRSVNDRTNCPAIQGFDRTKPIFDRTLSVDRPLFQALLDRKVVLNAPRAFSLGSFSRILNFKPIKIHRRDAFLSLSTIIKDLLSRIITNLRTEKRISISKRTLQRRKKETNEFHNVISIFSHGSFAKIIGKKARTRFLLHTRLSSLLKFFQNTI